MLLGSTHYFSNIKIVEWYSKRFNFFGKVQEISFSDKYKKRGGCEKLFRLKKCFFGGVSKRFFWYKFLFSWLGQVSIMVSVLPL